MPFLHSLIAALLLLTAAAACGQDGPLLIRGAHVFDGTGRPARIADVLVKGDRIARVAPRIAPPRDARVIKAAGMTLLPGLRDLHIHTRREAFADRAALVAGYAPYLAAGVTSINEYSVWAEALPAIRAITDAAPPAPHLALALRLGVPGGHGTESPFTNAITAQVATPEQARVATRRLIAARPDVIKVFADGWRYGRDDDRPSMDLPTLRAIVRVARGSRVPVMTHTVTLAGAKIAARAGVDAVVHGIGDAPVDAELIRLMRRNGVAYVPTMVVYEPQATRAIAPHERRLLPPIARVREEARLASPPMPVPVYEARRWATLQANLRALKQAGVRIGVGTDAGIGGVYHGWATLREIERLTRHGFTPAEALRAATSTAARIMRQQYEVGRIVPGLRADLILVGGRPDHRIADLYDLRRVFVSGREVSPASPADTPPVPAER